MREKLVRVERFEELRAGMLVVGKPCLACGRAHRGILMSIRPCSQDGRCFTLLPTPPCGSDECHIGPGAVKTGRIYRVVDGLEASDSSTSHRHTRKPAGERIR